MLSNTLRNLYNDEETLEKLSTAAPIEALLGKGPTMRYLLYPSKLIEVTARPHATLCAGRPTTGSVL